MPNEKALVSVIVPNYNNEQYLPACLDSILSQSYSNLEIICIDDASTDSSCNILHDYSRRFNIVKVVKNNINLGISKNRRKAINASNGIYITTLDSDDFYLDIHKIEREVDLIENHVNESGRPIISFSDIRLVDENGIELNKKSQNNIKQGDIFNNILLRDCMIPRDYMMTRDQYNMTDGFDSSIPIYEDWDLKIRLAYKNDFIYTQVKGIAYRRHGKGLSATSKPRHVKWLKHIYSKNSNLISDDQKASHQEQFNAYLLKTFGHQRLPNLLHKLKTILGVEAH